MILGKRINSKYVKNAVILMGDSVIRLLIGFVLSIFIARIFGPEKFGKINYVLAFISILQVLVIFGFDEIALKDMGLSLFPDNTIVKTVINLRWILAFFSYSLGFLIFYFFLNKELIQYYLILGCELFIYIYYIYKQWFQIKSLNKYNVLASQISFFFLSISKIIFLVFFNDLRIYSVLLVFSLFVETVVLYIFYKKFRNNEKGSFNKDYAKNLIKASLPMMLQNFAIIIYMKIDQIMIGKMLSNSAVGIYSISVTISEMVYFIPTAIVNSFYPKIADSKKNNEDYKKIIEKTGQINVFICLLFSIFCCIFIPFFILLFYGEAYKEAAIIIQIHSWAGIFVAIGCSNSCYIIFENKQKYSFYATVFGALINVILNYLFIPIMGGKGAALATLVTQSFSSFFFYSILSDKRFFKLRVNCLLIYRLIQRK